jgi:hypothetical protein
LAFEVQVDGTIDRNYRVGAPVEFTPSAESVGEFSLVDGATSTARWAPLENFSLEEMTS